MSVEPSGILDGIGNTPMIHLKRVSKRTGCMILAKAEYQESADQNVIPRLRQRPSPLVHYA